VWQIIIVDGLYTTLINLSPTVYRKRSKQKKTEAPKVSPLLFPSAIGRATSN
jgi:hypothetical protein